MLETTAAEWLYRTMKVVKEEKIIRSVTLRLNESVMKKVDEIAKKNELSRQRLIEAILEQVMSDKGFVLTVNKG